MPFIEYSGKKILFIHIPKTGGTSIEKGLGEIAPLRMCIRAIPGFTRVPPEHFTHQNIYSLFGEDYFDYVFTVVRNPYKRLESEYRMRSLLAKEQFFNELPKFPYWVEQIIEKTKVDRYIFANHLRPQIEFVGRGVYVYRYEDGLENIAQKVSETAGISLKLPEQRLLETNNTNIEITWTGESIRLVNEFYAEDFKAFNYPKQDLGFINA